MTDAEKKALSEAGQKLSRVALLKRTPGPRATTRRRSSYGKGAESFARGVHGLMHLYRQLRPWLLVAPHLMLPPEEMRDLVEKTEARPKNMRV